MSNSEAAYSLARERYAELGVDAEAALQTLATVPISLHCWQGDDVGGFEGAGAEARWRARGHGELSVRGARMLDELRR